MSGKPTTKKRGNGEGSIFYDKSKEIWVASYHVNGKRKAVYARTKTEARQKLILAQSSIINGTYFEPSAITIEQWLNLWLNEYMIGKREPKTVENHENNIRNHIVPVLGNVKLKDLQPYQVQRLYNHVEKKLSARTVKLVHITLHSAIKQAVFNDMLIQNVTEKCVLPKHNPKLSRALTTDEQRDFIMAIKNTPFELAFLFCLYAGLRRGEVLALQWKDINLETNRIRVNKTVSRVKNLSASGEERKTEIIIKHPKTKSSVREIPFSKVLLPYIKNHRIRMTERKLAMGNNFNPEEYLFTDTKGNPFDGGYLNTQFNKITNDLFELPATIHTLRHTFATRGAESGVSMKTMQLLCGHSKIDITADIYTHVSDAFNAKEIEKMDVIL